MRAPPAAAAASWRGAWRAPCLLGAGHRRYCADGGRRVWAVGCTQSMALPRRLAAACSGAQQGEGPSLFLAPCTWNWALRCDPPSRSGFFIHPAAAQASGALRYWTGPPAGPREGVSRALTVCTDQVRAAQGEWGRSAGSAPWGCQPWGREEPTGRLCPAARGWPIHPVVRAGVPAGRMAACMADRRGTPHPRPAARPRPSTLAPPGDGWKRGNRAGRAPCTPGQGAGGSPAGAPKAALPTPPPGHCSAAPAPAHP